MHGHINVKWVVQSEYPEGISVKATDVPCFYNLKLWMFCGWKEKLQMLHWHYGIRLSKGLLSFFVPCTLLRAWWHFRTFSVKMYFNA
jgi:hypothetical protein